MNVLSGVPDVKEMHYRNDKHVSEPSDYDCRMGNVECQFQDCSQIVCTRLCIEDHIWIRASQMPEYLAARLTRETT